MATKKTTTKAKTKTTKKPAAKSAAKVSSARTTKKTTAKTVKKVTATKSTVKVTRAKSSLSMFDKLNLLSLIVFVGLAIAAALLMKTDVFQLFVSHTTSDSLLSTKQTVFVPAIHSVVDVEIRWVLVAILALSSLVPLLHLTKYRKAYHDKINAGYVPVRWVDMAIVGALTFELLGAFSGINDLMMLKLLAGFVAMTSVFGWLLERATMNGGRPVRALRVAGNLTGLVAWVVLAVSALGTLVWGMVRSPWYVYAAYGVVLVGCLAYMVLQKQALAKKYIFSWTERNYLITNFLTRAVLAVVLIAGLRK